MRRPANTDDSSFGLPDVIGTPSVNAADAPTTATEVSDDSSARSGVIVAADGAPDSLAPVDGAASADWLDGAVSSATPLVVAHGDGSGWFLANDDVFQFDFDQNGTNDQIAPDSGNEAVDGFTSGADAATVYFASIVGSASAEASALNAFQEESGSSAGGSDFVGFRPSLDYSGAGSGIPTVNFGSINNTPTIAGVGVHDAAPPQTPAGPILAWVGDTGAGTGSGGTAGSGGTTVQKTTGASSGLVINVVYDASVSSAPAGFTTAVAQVVSYYESHFTTPVTITIDVGYGEIAGQSLGSGALGESETYLTSVSYGQLDSALAKNAIAIGDTAAAASLPATSPVSGQYWMATAEAKALGISGASASVDGYVGFSNIANLFAYNDSAGVPANQYDFFGVVAHEFSEVMGRQMMDGENFAGGASYEPLDLFHYSAAGVRDFSGTTAGYASADGGKTALDYFNTNPGGDFGDWAASAGHDSFLAYTGSGAVDPVTASDLTLMNLLGWDSTPPASPPPAPVVTVHLTSDTGASSSDGITANDALSGTADPGSSVTLTSGTKTLGTTTANASGIWSFTPSGLANGSQTVVATETNSAGETGSASLTFILDTIAPTVTSDAVSGTKVSAGAGTLTAGASVALTLALSEAVNLSGGAPTLTLNDGGTATYDAAHSTSKSLVFDYTVAAGQYATALAVTGINLHGATVTDVAGNAANFAGASATFAHILVDGTTPVATADHAHDTQGGTVSVAHAQAATAGVLANDTDSDPADVLTVSAVNGSATSVGHAVAGAYGTLTLSSDGSYAYTNSNAAAVTAAGGVAADFFNYTVSNGHGGTANSALTVLITGPTESYLAGAHGGTIKAGNGSYVLDGSAGNVNATAGNIGTQWLVGGAGDTMNGGNSTDTFLFAPSFGKETINNFNTAHDVIDLPQSLFANFAAVQADMHASGANTVIALEANDAITLSGIAVQNLHAQNFHFIV